MPTISDLSRPLPQAVLLDMDGVLFHGERPLPGAVEFLRLLADTPHLFLTNNPILSPQAVVAKFARIGLPIPRVEQVLTSAVAAAAWLAETRPGFRYFAVGAQGLHQALSEVGQADAVQADFVVVGEGEGLDYDSLTTGINLILTQGAQLVVTNPDNNVDAVVDGAHRILPGGGALVAPFVIATGQQPVVIGKPQPLLYRMALKRLGVAAGCVVMLGDRPDTDIAGASRLGLWTALVRTGRFSPDCPWPPDVTKPDWDAADLAELMIQWRCDCPDLLHGLLESR